MGAPREMVWTQKKTSCSMHSRKFTVNLKENLRYHPISSWSHFPMPMPFEQHDLGDLLLPQPLVAAANGSPSRPRGVPGRPAGKRGR